MPRGERQEEAASSVFCEVFSGHGDKLLEFFNKQRHNNQLCDCVLKVEGVDFPAHVCVLGAFSQTLLKRLMAVRVDGRSEIAITDVTYHGFFPLFEYMYTGVLKFELSHVKDVHNCAKTLGLAELERFFTQYVNYGNDEDFDDVEDICADRAKKHMGQHKRMCKEKERHEDESGDSSDSSGWEPPDDSREASPERIAQTEAADSAAPWPGSPGQSKDMVAPSNSSLSAPVSSTTTNSVTSHSQTPTAPLTSTATTDGPGGSHVRTNTSSLDDYLKFFEAFNTDYQRTFTSNGPIDNAGTLPKCGAMDSSQVGMTTSQAENMFPSTIPYQNQPSYPSNVCSSDVRGLPPSYPGSARDFQAGGNDRSLFCLDTNFNQTTCPANSWPSLQTSAQSAVSSAGHNLPVVPIEGGPSIPGETTPQSSGLTIQAPPIQFKTSINQTLSTSIDPETHQTVSSIFTESNQSNRSGTDSKLETPPVREENEIIDKKDFKTVKELQNPERSKPVKSGPRLRKRPAKRVAFGIGTDRLVSLKTGSSTTRHSSKTIPRIYFRTQVPFCVDSKKTAIQFGENLSQLIEKHGVVPGMLKTRTAAPKLIQKRKRTRPRKIHRKGNVDKEEEAEESLSVRKARKSKSERTDELGENSRYRAFICPLCPRGFVKESSLKKHCEGHAYGGIHKCHVCGQSYVRLCDFTRHVRSHGTLRCEYCEFSTKSQKLFVEHNLQKHESSKPFRCHYPNCNFSSNKLHDLDDHRLIHSEIKCFSCCICSKTFAQKGGLYSHMKSCLQKRDFLCDICGRAFNHLGSMKSHRRIHVGEKPFTCTECNARFSDHRNLKRHKRIHENTFPYACEYCEKRFRHSNSRKTHVQKHHLPSEAEPCQLVDKTSLPSVAQYMLPAMTIIPQTTDEFLQRHQRSMQPTYDAQIMAAPVFPGPLHLVSHVPGQ